MVDGSLTNRPDASGTRRRGILATSAIALILAAAACSSGSGGSDQSASASAVGMVPTSPPASSSDATQGGANGTIQGAWDGTWSSTSSPGVSGSFTVTFTESGNQLKGSITATNTPCIQGAAVTGTLDGNHIVFGKANTVDYTGTISGSSMSGTYAAPACGRDKGDWNATKA